MQAFDRIRSGIPQMDECLHSIRLGDNVVFRISDISAFSSFVEPFVRQAVSEGRKMIYVRFASHPPLVQEQPGVKVVHIELSHRFETFTVAIHNLIRDEGRGAFYVFDCLSELQTAWATDLMMGNFFRVTCPYLFQLDTVAYFPLIRGKHSFQAIAKIRDTAQVFLDVFPDGKQPPQAYYVRPLKVWNRDSGTMFLPHLYRPADGSFAPVTDGVQASHFYQAMNSTLSEGGVQNLDAWDRFFNDTQRAWQAGEDTAQQCARMCRIMMTRDEKLRVMIRDNFQPDDYFTIRDHMIGTGLIGGKSCGMLLARKIIQNKAPDLAGRLEPHDSYFIGSDVFYTYIVENGLWDLRVRQRSEEEFFSLAGEMAQRLESGRFPRDIVEQFARLLEYYGHDPVIVRSSSILEDGFGNAFAGKYESVFCSNAGSPEENLEAFENAVRTVYASTMSLSALDYRKRRSLDKRDEQMAILVQRVSGSHYEDYYMPCAAGVGYSFSPYRFLASMNPQAGMLRLVMGLGTMAVDRTDSSYPRLVNLDQPSAQAQTTCAQRHQYSQREIAVVDKKEKALRQVRLSELEDKLPAYLKNLLLEHDYDAERRFRDRGIRRSILFISCRGLVGNDRLMDDFRRMLEILQDAYGQPVDTEFTINAAQSGEYVINLLQCRPLQIAGGRRAAAMPVNPDPASVVLETEGTSMGPSDAITLDLIVRVDPAAYYRLAYAEKPSVTSFIHQINWALRGQGMKMMLMVPGRIGTSSPELGVPGSFADISEFSVICEEAESKEGYNPELSFGSHLFQDLVEANMIYCAVFEDSHTLVRRTELLQEADDLADSLAEKYGLGNLRGVVHVYDVRGRNCQFCHDLEKEKALLILPQRG